MCSVLSSGASPLSAAHTCSSSPSCLALPLLTAALLFLASGPLRTPPALRTKPEGLSFLTCGRSLPCAGVLRDVPRTRAHEREVLGSCDRKSSRIATSSCRKGL